MNPVPPSALTVSVPYFRGQEYLPRAIASVLAQRDGRWRLVVCDGGGDPGGPAGAVAAAAGDPRVSFLPADRRLTIAENWNRCLDAAGTDLVCLLHDDDELLPGYVGGMLAAADRHPAAAVLFCEARVIGPAGEPLFSFPDQVKQLFRPARGRVAILNGGPGLRAVMRGNFIMCPTMCFRKSRLGARRFAPGWSQVLDLEFTSRLLLDGEHLVGLPDVLYAYRRHPASATAGNTRSLLRFREEETLFGEVARRAAARGWDGAAAAARAAAIVKLNLGYCMAREAVLGRWAAVRENLAFLLKMV